MNKKFLNRVIKQIEEEKCPNHGEHATFKIQGQVIVIGNTCCQEFYDLISKKIEEQINQEMYKL